MKYSGEAEEKQQQRAPYSGAGTPDGLKQNIARGFWWKAVENGGDQLITFLISLVLARLLGPERYGTMALMLIFIAIANVVIQTGFQTALIQKQKVTEADLCSVFYCGLALAAVFYVLIFLGAPGAALFFGDEEIGPMLRVLALILFFGAVLSVLYAIIARRMSFRLQCAATIAADAVSGLCGVIAAFLGAGTWALVLQQLVKHTVLMVLLLCLLKWRPRLLFSLNRLCVLFSYGWKVLVSGLIDTIYNNLYTPVISKLYAPIMVGYYNRGNQFPQVIANAMAQTLQSVMLPAFSKMQEDSDATRRMLRRVIKLGSFVMFPMMFGLAAVADNLVRVLLGAAWGPAVPLLRLCCLSYCVWPMHVSNLQAVNARGRSDIYLKLELVKKAAGTLLLFASVPLGIVWMIGLKAAFDFVCTGINAWPNRRLCGYGPLAQWRDVLPEFLLAAGMGLFVGVLVPKLFPLFLDSSSMDGGLTAFCCLFVQVICGILIYAAGAALFRLESFQYLWQMLKKSGK